MTQSFGGFTYKYVDESITTLSGSIVDSAPVELDTINKLASSINDDPNYKNHTHDDKYYDKSYIDTAFSGTGSGTIKYDSLPFVFSNNYGTDDLFTEGYNSRIANQTGTLKKLMVSGYVAGSVSIELVKHASPEDVPDTNTVTLTPAGGVSFTGASYSGKKAGVSPSRSATNNSTDTNLSTYDNIFFNDFEYRFTSNTPRRFMSTKLTISTHNGWIPSVEAIFDVYYIPPGKTNPSDYVKFGSLVIHGSDADWSHHETTVSISNNGWVYADGVYMIHSTGALEEGWGHLEQVDVYTFEDAVYKAQVITDLSSWQNTSVSEGEIMSARLIGSQKDIIYLNVNAIVEVS